MYGYIYKTTNLLDGKIYIGQKRSPRFLGEGYLGSGKHLKLAVSKYGKENFKVELVEEIESEAEMDNREIYWISYYNATDDLVGYNISNGGNVNRSMSGEHNPRYGHHMTEEEKERQREGLKNRDFSGENNPSYNNPVASSKRSKTLMGHKVSDEARAKLKEYNLNKVYITDGKINKTVLPNNLEEWLSKGFTLGTVGFVYMANDKEHIRVPREEREKYESLGYVVTSKSPPRDESAKKVRSFKGELNPMYGVHRYGESNPNYGIKRAWVTNGIEDRCVKREEIDEFLKQGFRKGRTRCRGNA